MPNRFRNLLTARAVALTLGVLLLASLALNYVIIRHLRLEAEPLAAKASFHAGKCGVPALVGHWTFEEVSRDGVLFVPDQSGRGNHARLEVTKRLLGELRSARPSHVQGMQGRAMALKGKQWLAAGNNDCFTTERFTFAAWIWLDEVGEVPTIVGKTSWPHNGWWLMTTTRGIQREDRYLDLGILWPGGRAHVESGYQLPLKEWHHVVVTADNERRQVQFFVDGKAVSRHENVPKWQVNWDHEPVLGDYDGSTRWPWLGKIDDVRFYNYVLSDAESIALYRSDSAGPSR